MTSDAEFTRFIAEANTLPDALRPGQHAFNTLHRYRPDLANRIRATPIDPFYDDERLVAFYRFVTEEWHYDS